LRLVGPPMRSPIAGFLLGKNPQIPLQFRFLTVLRGIFD